MSLESEKIINYLQNANSNSVEFEKKLLKNFDKNLLLAGVLAVLLLISILYFDIAITSSIGFILFLIPVFFILVIALEISHNMAVTAMKNEQLVRLNAALLEIAVANSK